MIIFLDIDGVLTNRIIIARNPDPSRDAPFRESSVAALNRLISATKAQIVISSSWRVGRTVERLDAILKERGVRGDVIGATPQLTSTEMPSLMRGRGAEIIQWIEDHNYPGEYVVLDDEILDLVPHLPSDRIIHVVGGYQNGGLSMKDVEKWLSLSWFGGE